jgi:hypothetical protein
VAFSKSLDAASGYLYTCINPLADESTTGAVWNVQGYVTDFSAAFKKNKRAVYEHLVKTHSQPGKEEYSGKIGALYTKHDEGFAKLCEDDVSIALKFVLDPGNTGTPIETHYFSVVDLDNLNYNFGNQNDGGDISYSADFTFSEHHVV